MVVIETFERWRQPAWYRFDRDHGAMTRHGLASPHRAVALLPALKALAPHAHGIIIKPDKCRIARLRTAEMIIEYPLSGAFTAPITAVTLA